MPNSSSANDPLDFAQNLWAKMGFSLPGMVTPTFDVDEIEKRLVDLKAVESWLTMNLSMLQMTIKTLEMQSNTLKAVRAMSSITPEAPAAAKPPGQATAGAASVDSTQAAMWPWALMQQIQTQMQQAMEKPAVTSTAKPDKKPT